MGYCILLHIIRITLLFYLKEGLRPDNVKSTQIRVFSIEDQKELRENKVQFWNNKVDKTIIGDVEPTLLDDINRVSTYSYVYTNNFFENNIPVGEDARYIVLVSSDDDDVQNGVYHFDTIPPEVKFPTELINAHWYFGYKTRTITLEVNETLGFFEVTDNGNKINATYEDNKIIFELAPGFHKINVVIRDLAGNETAPSAIKNIYIGMFWLWVMLGVLIASIIIYVIWKSKRKWVLIIAASINVIEIITIILMTTVLTK